MTQLAPPPRRFLSRTPGPALVAVGALALLAGLSGCSGGDGGSAEPAITLEPGHYAAAGRDRLCVGAGGRSGGAIVYGPGDSNCSARGPLRAGPDGTVLLVPEGEATNGCALRIARDGDGLRLSGTKGACDYYCGPGAAWPDKAKFVPSGDKAKDFAGEPLCG